jgi:hypothetical protein
MALTDGIEIPLGNLKQQLREAQKEVQNLADKFGATSEQAIKAAKKAADLKDRIGDAKALTDAFNPDAKFKGLAQSLGAVAGGFSAVQGAIGLLGSDSKELEQTMLKVQSAMALSQGLNSLGEAKDAFNNLSSTVKNSTLFIKANEMANKAAAGAMKLFGVSVETTSTSFKVLKGAIAATGIGILIIAIGELVSAFQQYEGAAEKAKKKQLELNESIKKGAKVAIDTETATLENSRKLEVANAKAKGASEQEIFEIEQRYKKLKIESTKRYNKEVANINVEEDISNQRNLKAQQTDLEVAALDFQTKQLENQKNANKQTAQERKQHNEEVLKLAEEARQKELEIEQKKRDEVLDIDRKILETKRQIALLGLNAKDKELLELEFKFQDEYAKVKDNFDARLKLDIWYDLEQQKIQKEGDVEKAEKDKEEHDKFLARLSEKAKATIAYANVQVETNTQTYAHTKATEEAKIVLWRQAAQTMADLSELAGKQTKVGKALALASIGIDTAIAIGALTKHSEKNELNSVTFGGAGALQFATGMIRILANIKKAKDLLSSPNVNPSIGGSSAPASMSTSPMQPQLPQASTTNLSQSSINALGNQAIKAYVVETDMTTNQQRIKAIQQRARFG